MPPLKHHGSRNFQAGCTKQGPRLGSTEITQGISLLRPQQPAISPALIAREKKSFRTWTMDYLGRWSKNQPVMGLEALASTFLGNHSSILVCLKLWLISRNLIGATPSYLPQMAHTSIWPWMNLHNLELTKYFGPGAQRPSSRQRPKRNSGDGESSESDLSKKSRQITPIRSGKNGQT